MKPPKSNVCVTSGIVFVTNQMDLDTSVAAQLQEITRLLGLQGAPAEPHIDPVRSSIQGILSDFWLIFKDFRKFSNFQARRNKFVMDNAKISDRVTSEGVSLNDRMDRDALVAAQRHETARVLGL